MVDLSQARSTRVYAHLEHILEGRRESFLRQGFPAQETRVDRLNRAFDLVSGNTAQPRPLALCNYGTDRGNIRSLELRTTSAGMTINDLILHCTDPRLPFGGIGRSGIGYFTMAMPASSVSATQKPCMSSPTRVPCEPWGIRLRRERRRCPAIDMISA